MEDLLRPAVSYIVTQGAFAIAFLVMAYLVIIEIRRLREGLENVHDKIGEVVKILVSLTSVTNTNTEQLSQVVTKLLDMIERKMK